MTTAASSTTYQKSDRKTATVVGVLFLSSTATFAIGSSLITAFFSGSNQTTSLVIGVLLEVYTGLAVAGIGIAMLPLLKHQQLQLARAYLGLRILECLTIVAIGIYMLATHQQIQNDAIYIYFFTATGGIIFSYLLYLTKLIPRPLSGLGILGYLVLLLGIPSSLLGIANLNAGWGMVFFVPGGLFELILPLWLFVYGFKVARV